MPCHGVVKANQRTKKSTPVKANQPTKTSPRRQQPRAMGRRRGSRDRLSIPRLTERAARGKAERKLVPLSAHGEWEPSPDRRDPVELLEEQAATRVPELVPIRYGRMLVSPFTFYRGAAYLMAADLAGAPRTGLTVQLCGDAHLSNFGVFAAPDRRLVFSVNDFDETLPGPFEWDVKRLVASFAVAGRDRASTQAARRDQPGCRAGPIARRCRTSPDANARRLVRPPRRRGARRMARGRRSKPKRGQAVRARTWRRHAPRTA